MGKPFIRHLTTGVGSGQDSWAVRCAIAYHARGIAQRNGEVRDRLGHHRTRADDALLSDVGRDGRPFTDPRVAANGDVRPATRLLPDRDVQPVDSVLPAA